MSFEKMGLDERLIKGLCLEGITEPVSVQELAFPVVMEGKDAAVQSETGSGKTLAYLLPLMQQLVQKSSNKVLVLVPTHELAMQVVRQVRSLSGQLEHVILAEPVVGNVNIRRQIEALKARPQIIAGTTGRILELMQKKKIPAHLIQTIVIDEADKMLDKNQAEDTRAVLKKCMRSTQKLYFSASLPDKTLKLIKELSPDVVVLRTRDTIAIPENIHHLYFVCGQREKLQMLRSVISAVNPKKAIVFINRAYDIEEAAERLKHHHYQAECIHGTHTKEERRKVVEGFRAGKLRILIASDVAARGLHFEGVDAVVHYSIPENPKDYLHRAGRSGRNGRDGMSISLVTGKELPLIQRCQREFAIKLQECVLKNGMLLPAEALRKRHRMGAGTKEPDRNRKKAAGGLKKRKQTQRKKHAAGNSSDRSAHLLR